MNIEKFKIELIALKEKFPEDLRVYIDFLHPIFVGKHLIYLETIKDCPIKLLEEHFTSLELNVNIQKSKVLME